LGNRANQEGKAVTELLCWGHNPGQRFCKDTLTVNGARRDLKPYPAVIAPWQSADDTGLARKSKDLTATVNGRHYIGGAAAERLPLNNRQMANGRLEANSPTVLIATALPVAWRDATAEEQIKAHLRAGLRELVTIKDIFVQSEPNAVIGYEMLDDNGQIRTDQAALAKGLVCVGDIGGATLNRSVVEGLRALAGQAASPLFGSRQVVEALMQSSGQQYIDAEKRLEAAVRAPGQDSVADALLAQYREAVIGELQRAWSSFRPVAYLFAGGTAHWLADDLRRAFAHARIVANPQQAIAIGLWRYARRKALRGT
jgi:hypothetical protein